MNMALCLHTNPDSHHPTYSILRGVCWAKSLRILFYIDGFPPGPLVYCTREQYSSPMDWTPGWWTWSTIWEIKIVIDGGPAGMYCVRCFKQIWKAGKVGKVGREGLIKPTWNQLWLPVHCGIFAISWQDFLSKLPPYLTDILNEFKYLHPNQTFSNFPYQIVHLFYHYFC